MNPADAEAVQRYGSGLLERAVAYAVGVLDSLAPLTAEELLRPTPCEGWDLWTLLGHLDASLAALNEAVHTGAVRLDPHAEQRCAPSKAPSEIPFGQPPSMVTVSAEADLGGPGGALVDVLRNEAGRLLATWKAADHGGCAVLVGGSPLGAGIVAATGAVELVVHAWDVTRACGRDIEIPPVLAGRMLRLVPRLVPDRARPGLFGPPVPVPPGRAPGDRLVAFLGRDPSEPRPP